MYKIKADGVVLYDPSVNDSAYHVLSPRAKFEMNKSGSLSFIMLPDNVCYNSLHKMKTIITAESGTEVIFRGRVLDTTTDLYGMKEVYCEGELAYLQDSVQTATEFKGTAEQYLRKVIEAHNAQVESYKQFTVGEVTAVTAEHTVDVESDSYTTTLNDIRSILIDEFKGYLVVRWEGNVRYLDYVKEFNHENSQIVGLAAGYNMIEFEDEFSTQDLCTVMIPLGATTDEGRVTISGGNVGEGGGSNNTTSGSRNTTSSDGGVSGGTTAGTIRPTIPEGITINGDMIEDTELIEKYGRIVKCFSWEKIEDSNELLKMGLDQMALMKERNTLTITGFDMNVVGDSLNERFKLGDTIRIMEKSGVPIDERFEVCVAIDLDMENPEKSKYTFGMPMETLTDNTAKSDRSNKRSSGHMHKWLTETDNAFEVYVATNDLAMVNLTARVDDLENSESSEAYVKLAADLEKAQADIGTLFMADSAFTAAMSTLQSDMDSAEANINTLFSDKADNSSVQSSLNLFSGRIDDVETALAGLEASLTLPDGTMLSKANLALKSDVTSAVASINARFGENEASIQAVADSLGSYVTIDAMETRIKGFLTVDDGADIAGSLWGQNITCETLTAHGTLDAFNAQIGGSLNVFEGITAYSGTFGSSVTVGGKNVSLEGHTHDDLYVKKDELPTAPSVYWNGGTSAYATLMVNGVGKSLSTSLHNHDDVYVKLSAYNNHTHPQYITEIEVENGYSPIDHTHDYSDVFAALDHNHDDVYIKSSDATWKTKTIVTHATLSTGTVQASVVSSSGAFVRHVTCLSSATLNLTKQDIKYLG